MPKQLHRFLLFIVLLCIGSASARAAEAALTNGADVVSQSLRVAPSVSISLLVKAGAADETAQTAGWRQLVSNAMMRATTSGKAVLEGPQIAKAAEAAGGQIHVRVLDDAVVFTASGDSSRQEDLATLLMHVVLHPRLAETDFAASREAMLRNLGNLHQNPVINHSSATEMLQGLLYRDASGLRAYGLPPLGTVDSLVALSDASLRDLYKKYFSPSNMVLSFSGDVHEAALREIFAQMPVNAPRVEAPILTYVNLAEPTVRVTKMPIQLRWMLIGFRIDSHATGDDLVALRVLTAALAETAPSLLSQKLLTPNGINGSALANQLSARLHIRRYGSELLLSIQGDVRSPALSQNEIYQNVTAVLDQLKAAPLSPKQLQSAITYAQGDWATTHDSSAVRAVLAGYAKAQGIFPDNQWLARLNQVTAQDVQRVAQKYLDHSAVVIAIPASG